MKELTRRILKYVDVIQNMNVRSSKVLQGLFSGLHKSPYLGFSADFEDHREYNPGDNIKLINWPLWGRTEKLFIKRFKEDTNTAVHIILDSTSSMDYGRSGEEKYLMALELSALLYLLFSRQNDKVVLSSFGDSIIPVFSSSQKQEPGRFMSALNALHASGKGEFFPRMREFRKQVSRRSIVILISDMIFAEKDLKKGLGVLSFYGHDIIVIQPLTPEELGVRTINSGYYYDPEDPGKRRYSDGEGFSREMGDWLGAVESLCRDLGINRVLVPTDTDPLKVLMSISRGGENGVS